MSANDDFNSEGAASAHDAPTSGAPGVGRALEHPTASVIKPREPRETFPERIESYRILRRLGAGGMGVVFEAEQENPRRLVALKIINAGVASREALRRFQHEAQVLGRLHHAGIAQIYEAGMFDTGEGGRPFFAMELVKGDSITHFANTRHLGTADRLELLAKVCDAVQHAHLKAIIHRDLKPANILVTHEGQPKVLDFGVARATDADVRATTIQTQADQLIGTLPYMSPEQALGDSNELDMRSDVYALGVVGYELLTGRLPYQVDRRTVFEAVRVIREEEPTRLSAIDRSYRGDIETIFAKALEKDRLRRYQSAADFAADIRRFLTDEPIVARPPSLSYQLRKFARRNKAVVVGLAAVLIVLVAGAIVSTTFAIREGKARILAQAESEKARQAQAQAQTEAERAQREAENARKAEAQAQSDAERARLAEGEAQQQATRAQTEADKATALSKFHRDMLSRANPAFAQGRDVTVREVLDQAGRDIGSMFPQQPQLEATIRSTIGESYTALSEFQPAIAHFERAAQLFKQSLGDRDRETLSAEANLAVAYHDLGRMDESVALSRSVLERRKEVLGPDHPETIGSEVNLATALADIGEIEEAEQLFRSTIERSTRVAGEGDRTTLTAIGGLAVLLKNQGHFDESAQHFERVIELCRKHLGENDHDTLSNMDNYTTLLAQTGDHDRARQMLRDLLERHIRIFGPTHAATLIIKNNLAITLQNSGAIEEADQLFRSVVTDGKARFGEGHPDVLVAMANLAGLLYIRGEFPEAETLLREAVDVQLRKLGEDHHETITAMNSLALVLADQQKNDEAEVWYRRALQVTQRTQEPENPQLLTAQSEFAAFLRDTGKYEEAERLFTQTLAVLRRTRGGQAQPTIAALYQYIGLLQKMERFEEALPLSEELLQSAKSLPAGHPFGMMTPFRYGLTMLGLGRYAEAEKHMLDSLQRLEAASGVDPSLSQRIMQELVKLYERWNKPEEAAKWRERVEKGGGAGE